MIKFNVAIDGPVGSGKTTIGKSLAKRINYNFFDSGLLYRHFALFYKRSNFSSHSIEKAIKTWDNLLSENKKKIISELTDNKLTSLEIGELASQLSPNSKLRKIIFEFQKELFKNKGWIVVGRDITSKVLPEAEIKIYLTASLEERTKRRSKHFEEKVDLQKVKEEIISRDKRDKERNNSPLKKTTDSFELDTTNLTLEKSVDLIIKCIREKNLTF